MRLVGKQVAFEHRPLVHVAEAKLAKQYAHLGIVGIVYAVATTYPELVTEQELHVKLHVRRQVRLRSPHRIGDDRHVLREAVAVACLCNAYAWLLVHEDVSTADASLVYIVHCIGYVVVGVGHRHADVQVQDVHV